MTRILLALVITCGFSALAQTESTLKTPSPASAQGWDLFSRRIYADFYTEYHGADVNHLGSHYSSDNTGLLNPAAVTGFDNEITAAYTDEHRRFGVGPDVMFVNSLIGGREFVMGDSGLKVFDNATIDTESFRFSNSLGLLFPMNQSSRARGMAYALRADPYFWYKPPGTRFKLGAWFEAKYYAQVTSGKTFRLYADPYAVYQVSDRFALNLEWELDSRRDVEDQPFQFKRFMSDIKPGVFYRFGRTTVVNPYIKIFPAAVSADTTFLGVILSAVLL